MKLHQCTEAELLDIVKRMSILEGGEISLESALDEIENARKKKRIEKAYAAYERAKALTHKYSELIQPYQKSPVTEVPLHILEMACEYRRGINAANDVRARILSIDESFEDEQCF